VSKNKKKAYSESESRILNVLRAEPGRKMTTLELIDKTYSGNAPFNARQSIVGTMKGLARKIDVNGEKFTLKRTDRAGPVPLKFWLEDRAV
jgi:hypothetical protein